MDALRSKSGRCVSLPVCLPAHRQGRLWQLAKISTETDETVVVQNEEGA